MRRIMKALLVAAIPLFALPTIGLAQGEGPQVRPQGAGEVVSVNLTAGEFVMERHRDGEQLTVIVTEETVFRSIGGAVQGLEELEVGMKVIVAGEPSSGGIAARAIAVAQRGQLRDLSRAAGEVVRVDPRAGLFTLESRAGELLELQVTGDTRFFSPQGTVDSLEDVAAGMQAFTVYRERDGVNVALRVGVRNRGERPERPEVDVRVRGEITALSSSSITIQPRSGEAVTMALTEGTVIKSLGGERLEPGDKALALGEENEDGRLLALLVISRPVGRGEGPPAGDGVDHRFGSQRDMERAPERFAP